MYFLKKSDRLSSTGPEITAFVSHCSANFQLILDYFIPNFKYEDSENMKADLVNTVVFNVHHIKHSAFLGHKVEKTSKIKTGCRAISCKVNIL